MVQLHYYEVSDVTDDSSINPMQQHVSFPYYRNDMQFPTHLFLNIAPEWLGHLQDDIDCTKIFKIKCLPTEWVERTHHLQVLHDAFFEKERPYRNKEGK